MKNIKNIEKIVFMIVFFLGISIYSMLSMEKEIIGIKNSIHNTLEKFSGVDNNIKEIERLIKTGLADVESSVSTNLYKRYDAIESYGKINRIIGKKEINDMSYSVDSKSGYNNINFWKDTNLTVTREYAQQMQLLKKDVEAYGGKFFYMAFPYKLDILSNVDNNGMPYNADSERMDQLLLWNRRYNIDYIDFRQTLKKSEMSFYDAFYKTDHHWTAEAAFESFCDTIDFMNNKYNENLDPEYYYRDINNYNVYRKKNVFMGAQARDVGLEFANLKLEDFQILKPKFQGNIVWDDKEGDYEDTVLVNGVFESDNIYESDSYSYYLNGIEEKDSIINLNNKDGLKILFLRDSFASPLIINMIPFCSQIDCIWGLHAEDDEVKQMIKENNYDYVIVGCYIENINDDFFQFYREYRINKTKKAINKQ